MKKLFIVAIITIAFLNLQASDWVNVTSSQPAQSNVSLISSQITQSSIHFSLNGFWKEIVETNQGNSWLISLENGAPLLLKGAPDLPIFAGSIIVPDMSHMKVNIVSSQYVEFNDVLIAPSKGNLTRDIDPATIPYEFGKQYDNDAFYPGELAKINGEDPVMEAAMAQLDDMTGANATEDSGDPADLAESLPGSWTWMVASDSINGPAEIANPENYILTFNEDGTVNVKADCNNAQGSYTADDSSLSIQLGPTTMVYCGDDSHSDDFLKYLGFAAIYFFQDGNLLIDLMADGGTMGFTSAEDGS